MTLIPLPAFQDNDLWMLHDGRRAPGGDPGDAQPVPACLQRDRLQLEAILVTPRQRQHALARRVACPRGHARCGPRLIGTIRFGRCDLIRYSPDCADRQVDHFLRAPHGAAPQAARSRTGARPPDDVAAFATHPPWDNESK